MLALKPMLLGSLLGALSTLSGSGHAGDTVAFVPPECDRIGCDAYWTTSHHGGWSVTAVADSTVKGDCDCDETKSPPCVLADPDEDGCLSLWDCTVTLPVGVASVKEYLVQDQYGEVEVPPVFIACHTLPASRKVTVDADCVKCGEEGWTQLVEYAAAACAGAPGQTGYLVAGCYSCAPMECDN